MQRYNGSSDSIVPKTDVEPHIINLPEESQVPVRKGDVIGWYGWNIVKAIELYRNAAPSGSVARRTPFSTVRVAGLAPKAFWPRQSAFSNRSNWESCSLSRLMATIWERARILQYGPLLRQVSTVHTTKSFQQHQGILYILLGSPPVFSSSQASTIDVNVLSLSNFTSTVLMKLSAKDDDVNDVVTYYLVSVEPDTDLFMVNTTTGLCSA
jgi:hypothetical protein